jgi:hypothetical protein
MSRLSERLEEERGITFAEFKEKTTFENSFVQFSYFAHEAGRRTPNSLKGLPHEIDFKNVDKNLQNLA